jgi:DNA helicase IV
VTAETSTSTSPATSTASLRREIAAEQRHLDRVYARLAQLRADAQGAERDGYRLARVGNLGALVERDAMVFHAARRRARLDAEHEGLVFGRLDRQSGEVEYVGRLGIRDTDTTPLLIDWRAPAAADFYQATPADPRGVLRRRMIRTRGETVIGLDDDLLDPAAELPVVGDGALLASLTRATGSGMRDIVATIQREQDEAIRSPATGATLVEGGPGTGKTAVALHRAAYLLYADRDRFAGGGILVVGPSPVFMRYIETVLPSLGEQSATLRSLGELVEGVVASRVDSPFLAGVKGSLRMLTVLRRAVREPVPDAPRRLRLTWRGTPLRVEPPTLERIRRRALAGRGRPNEVRRAAFDGIFDALWEELGGQVPAGRHRRADFEDELSDRPDFRDFLRSWWPLLRPARVLAGLGDPDRLGQLAGELLSPAEVAGLAGSFAGLADSGPTVADVALLDELDTLLGLPPRPRRRRPDPFEVAPGVREVTTYADREAAARAARRERPDDYRDYAHVVVDEAQDVSPMQWRMLGRRGRYASWTVVGDPAQRAWTGDPAELDQARDAALRGRRRHWHLLTTNYRNSVEIFERAAAVIRPVAPDAPLPVPVRSTGVPPVEHIVPATALPGVVATAAAELLAQVEGTVGVITPVDRREQVAGWLTPDPRLQVVTSLEAKGMEYDGVVLVEPGGIAAAAGDHAAGRRALYVALSRATQRLTAVATAGWD